LTGERDKVKESGKKDRKGRGREGKRKRAYVLLNMCEREIQRERVMERE
jgi:hypothetical protein